MSRSAIIQARVRPEIKFAGEQVLRNLGLTMTEAMELFVRRLILDQKMPFEVVAFDDAMSATLIRSWENHKREGSISTDVLKRRPYRHRKKEGQRKRKIQNFRSS